MCKQLFSHIVNLALVMYMEIANMRAISFSIQYHVYMGEEDTPDGPVWFSRLYFGFNRMQI